MKNVIEEIEITPIRPKSGLIAIASFVLDKKLYLGSIGIYTRLSKPGLRLTFPTKKVGGKSFQIYHPITKELTEEINRHVLKEAEKILNSLEKT